MLHKMSKQETLPEQEKIFKLQLLDQQATQLVEQTRLIESEIQELKELKKEMEIIKNSQEEEIFSEIKKGIYLKSNLKKENLLIEIGSKIFVPKSFGEVNEIIDREIEKLNNAGKEMSSKINEINKELEKIIG